MTYSRDEIMSPHPIILIKALTQAFRNPQIYQAYTFPSAKVCLPLRSHPETQLWLSHSPISSDRSARGRAQHGNWMSVVLRGRKASQEKFHGEIKRAGIAKDRRKQIGWSPSLGPRGLQYNIENSSAGATSSHNPMTGCGLLKITFQVKKLGHHSYSKMSSSWKPRAACADTSRKRCAGLRKSPWAWRWSSFCIVRIALCHSTFKWNGIKGNCTVILWPYPAFKMLSSPFLGTSSHLAYLWSWLSSACLRPHCSPERLQLRLLTWKATIAILSKINCSFIWLPLHLICSSVMTISGL